MTESSPQAVPQEAIEVEEEGQYPEGGTKAWLVVFGAWCAMIPSMGLLTPWLFYKHKYQRKNCQVFRNRRLDGFLAVTPSSYIYAEVKSGRYLMRTTSKVLIIPGCVGIVAAIVLFSLSHEFYQFLLSFGVLGGISASMLFNPSISAIGHWFSKRRALATGVACTAGGAGGVAFPLIILYLTPKIGFAWAMRVIGLICAATSVAACLLLRKRLPPNRKAGAAIDLRALSDTKYAITTAAIFLVEFAVFIPYTYISSYAIHMGLSAQKAYLLNAVLNAGAIPGRALPGYVADRFGVFNVMLITSSLCATLVLALWLTAPYGNEAMVTSFTVLFGFWSGAAISLTPVCIGQVCRTEDYGKRTGTTFSLSSIGALTGIPIAGAILQAADGEYWGVTVLAGVSYTAAAAMFGLARVFVGGWGVAVIV